MRHCVCLLPVCSSDVYSLLMLGHSSLSSAAQATHSWFLLIEVNQRHRRRFQMFRSTKQV
jgi:hypothetical protein